MSHFSYGTVDKSSPGTASDFVAASSEGSAGGRESRSILRWRRCPWWDRRRLTAKATGVRGVANAHAWVMVAFGGLSFCDILLRRGLYPDADHTPALVVGVTLATGMLAVIGGTLGGSLTFEEGLAVEHPSRVES